MRRVLLSCFNHLSLLSPCLQDWTTEIARLTEGTVEKIRKYVQSSVLRPNDERVSNWKVTSDAIKRWERPNHFEVTGKEAPGDHFRSLTSNDDDQHRRTIT